MLWLVPYGLSQPMCCFFVHWVSVPFFEKGNIALLNVDENEIIRKMALINMELPGKKVWAKNRVNMP